MQNLILALGSNLGDREEFLRQAKEKINQYVGIVRLQSAVYEYLSWPDPSDPPFLNQLVVCESDLSDWDALLNLMTIEYGLGRRRPQKNAPRVIDIDILAIDSKVVHSPLMHIPHPRLQERIFVLEPWNEIYPSWVHPILLQPIADLYNQIKEGT